MSAAFAALQARDLGQSTAVIPITAEQWHSCLSDGAIDAHRAAWRKARAALCSRILDDTSLNRRLRPASISFIEEVQRLGEKLELLSIFNPGSSRQLQLVDEWHGLLFTDAFAVLEAAVHQDEPPAAPTPPVTLEVSDGRDRDVLHEIFGVPGSELVDENGSFCDTRVIASYRLRLDQLQAACDPIIGAVAEHPPSLFTAVSAVRDLATSASPLITLWAARDIRSRILSAFDSDQGRTRKVLADAWKDGDKEWVSFGRLQMALRRAEAAKESPSGTDAEFAAAILEAYRHMAEGITRRWVGVLLLLSGLEGPPPGLGSIAEPAVSRLGGLGLRIKASLIPSIRNVEAHDDFVFDEDSGLLVSGDSTFDPQEILARLTDLDVLQRGLIAGRLAAFADQPQLSSERSDPIGGLSPGSALAFARQRFGHAGQSVRSFVRNRDLLEIVIDDLRSEACNPCFVALTQAARALPTVSRFTVAVKGGDEPVIDLSAGVLRENWAVFELAARYFSDGLPQATFLPCTTWCRLACESQEEAALAAAWLALNDAQHALNDAEASPVELARLRRRLEVVVAATSSTIRVLPEGSYLSPLGRAERVLRASMNAVGRPDPYGTVLDRILGVRDKIGGPPAVLPTLDPHPLSGPGSYPHPAS